MTAPGPVILVHLAARVVPGETPLRVCDGEPLELVADGAWASVPRQGCPLCLHIAIHRLDRFITRLDQQLTAPKETDHRG